MKLICSLVIEKEGNRKISFNSMSFLLTALLRSHYLSLFFKFLWWPLLCVYKISVRHVCFGERVSLFACSKSSRLLGENESRIPFNLPLSPPNNGVRRLTVFVICGVDRCFIKRNLREFRSFLRNFVSRNF